MQAARKDLLNKAIEALHSRTFYAAFPEHPAPAVYGETADADGKAAFEGMLNKHFEALATPSATFIKSDEVSPYTQENLGISYPSFSADELVSKADSVKKIWKKTSIEQRADILLHSLELFKNKFFPIAYATMHTTGQAYMMSFQASGPHAADRALEALAAGYEELTRFPHTANWVKPMGKISVSLDKQWIAQPKGISLVIGCSTFPTWNSVSGIYASLITGNPVIVKPHPTSILPIAIVVADIQKALVDANLPADIIQLGVDTLENPITKTLAENELITLIDYTGGTAFGNYVESLSGKTVFTEKAGVNSMIIDSVASLDPVLQNLAFSLSLYSGQMCTAPQNFFVPKDGIKTDDGIVSAEEFAQKLADAVTALIDNPKAGPHIIGAIQNPATINRLQQTEAMPGTTVLNSRTVANPMFANARTASPSIKVLESSQVDVYNAECFGPIAFVIKTENSQDSVAKVKALAKEHGALSCGAYTTSDDMMEHIMDEMAEVFVPVSFNLTGPIYVNQNAAFSDYHGTGANPAGNASFANPEFVTKRFAWVGMRKPAVV